MIDGASTSIHSLSILAVIPSYPGDLFIFSDKIKHATSYSVAGLRNRSAGLTLIVRRLSGVSPGRLSILLAKVVPIVAKCAARTSDGYIANFQNNLIIGLLFTRS